MVYNGGMTRTQVYLRDEELELLDRLSAATGASRSELIRRAIHGAFGQPSKSERLRALERSAGSWKGRELTGAEYVDRVRGDLNQRLRRLGLE
ncbi:MAG TPA: CopG family transcriptional regulator [Thermoanaerobaculia bacterium]|nr:CopG family transcriptional regulator [Thermoanaerobaculia bacterium]